MEHYRMADASARKKDPDLIYATQPAQAGTYIVYPERYGSTCRSVVLLWGLLRDGTLVPITLNGPWDDGWESPSFVLYPDGSCAIYHRVWASSEDAIRAFAR